MKITEALENKRILIWGYGREGKSSEEFIKKNVKYKSLDVFEGKPDELNQDDYDIILKSPGISMLERTEKITSQTELFLNEFSKQTIGVSGTKGKSTTSSMINHVLNYGGKKSVLLGNIGKPCFDMVDEIDEDTAIVFELSCHQLLHITKAPHISVFLNLYEEHLDYYGTFEKYFKAKSNIIANQTEEDFSYVGENVPFIETKAEVTIVSKPHMDFKLKILGEHNKLNAEFVYKICSEHYDLSDNVILDGIAGFTGLPHRLEYFGNYKNIDFYDDSISTIPGALINAVLSVKNAKTLIVGGMDRGIEYGELSEFIEENKQLTFILAYATGKRVYEEMNGDKKNCIVVDDLEAAVKCAFEVTGDNNACILSPAAPSYGYFKNFEERGDVFKELVKNYN